MIKNTLLKVLVISLLISSLFLTSCTTEEKTITVQDDVQKMSNELDEDGRIFTKVRDFTLPKIEDISIVSVANDSSPVFSRYFYNELEESYANLFTINSNGSTNMIESSLTMLDGYSNNRVITYFKNTELWLYNVNTKEKKLITDIPESYKTLSSSESVYSHKISGSNDYLSIVSFASKDESPNSIIRILDTNTGEFYTSSILNNLHVSNYVFYSNVTKKFYTFILSSEIIAEFSLDDMNPKKTLSAPGTGLGINNIKLSQDGNYIYLTQKDNYNGELSLCRFNLINKQITSLLKIVPEEKGDNLLWSNFDIVGNSIIYSFSVQSDKISYASQESKLYAANISEDSLTNTQLLYNSPKGEISALGFYLSEDGTKLLTTVSIFSPPEGDTSKSRIISTQNSIYEKSK